MVLVILASVTSRVIEEVSVETTFPDLTCARQWLGFAACASIARKDEFHGGRGVGPW